MTIECIEIPMDENIGEELTRLVYEFQQEHYHKPSHFTLSPRKLLQLKAFMSEKKMFPSFTSNGDSWTWMGVPIFCGDIEGIVTGIPYELITKFEYARQKKL